MLFHIRTTNLEMVDNWMQGSNCEEEEIRLVIPHYEDLNELRDSCMLIPNTIPASAKKRKFIGKLIYNNTISKASFYLTGQNKDHIEFDNKWSLKSIPIKRSED